MWREESKVTFENLVKSIPENEINILKHLWDYFLENEKWPSGRYFRRIEGKNILNETIKDLSPLFIMYQNIASTGKYHTEPEYYELTLEGLFAIEGFEGVRYNGVRLEIGI